jgi:hypothetical protein
MARLVLINDAPGSGKSTLARMYVDQHPLVLALDVDVVRAMLGRWLDDPVAAGLIARRMAFEMARVQLTAGRDVWVPQFLGRLDFVFELEDLCDKIGAVFVEVVLLSNRRRPLTASCDARFTPIRGCTATLRSCWNDMAESASCAPCTPATGGRREQTKHYQCADRRRRG